MEEASYSAPGAAPKAYPKNSAIEANSVDTVHFLLNRKYVRGEIRVNDKVPNFDGTLDVTDESGIFLGQLNVQVKTLPKGSGESPGYSCDEQFIAACERSVLPVILLVADNENVKVYWRHIDSQTRIEFLENKRGKTYTLKFAPGHFIDRSNQSYIDIWIKIIEGLKNRENDFDNMKQRLHSIEAQIEKATGNLSPVVDLPAERIALLQEFLDKYNFVLENQLPGIRENWLGKYWKIGIGVTAYSNTSISLLIIPILYGKNVPMIRKLVGEDKINILNPEHENRALIHAMQVPWQTLERAPLQYAYNLLENEVLRIAAQRHLPVADSFIANEYIISFLDTFNNYLGIEKSQQSFSLARLKFLLNRVMPIVEEKNKFFREGLTELHTTIDSNSRQNFSNAKYIQQAIDLIETGYVPKVKVTLRSQEYPLLFYYIAVLETKGINEATSVYKVSKNKGAMNWQFWPQWDRSVLLPNLTIFYENFYRVYAGLIEKNFKGISAALQLTEADLTIFVLYNSGNGTDKPYLERFSLEGAPPKGKKILFYKKEDPDCPVDSYRHFMLKDYAAVVDELEYKVISMQRSTLDFLFSSLPMYSILKEILQHKLQKFFNETTREPR